MKNTKDNRFATEAKEFEEMMWQYAASGRDAFNGLPMSEAEKDILAHRLTAAMREYDRLFGDVEDEPNYDRDEDYRELIDGYFAELRHDMTALRAEEKK